MSTSKAVKPKRDETLLSNWEPMPERGSVDRTRRSADRDARAGDDRAVPRRARHAGDGRPLLAARHRRSARPRVFLRHAGLGLDLPARLRGSRYSISPAVWLSGRGFDSGGGRAAPRGVSAILRKLVPPWRGAEPFCRSDSRRRRRAQRDRNPIPHDDGQSARHPRRAADRLRHHPRGPSLPIICRSRGFSF